MSEESAADIASAKTGLTPDQIKEAVAEYRAAAYALEVEPEWTAIIYISGPKDAIAQYGAEGTEITLQIESHRAGADTPWKEHRYYVFADKPYELFHEAKTAELVAGERCQKQAAPNVTDLTALQRS